ncbi:Ribonuclease HII [Anaerovibrio sp. JC8]|uniref:ribonuclease HII n=1 Tax=Anaerovibrio sp. JC8 TaxID=1240085 RepID=UPI000A0D66CE|nr:ribonuclease HII [Anaerovibrio sp. JC8]ORU00727.1 Ribonuclease HII [Anaerovibrio sp. JC8]
MNIAELSIKQIEGLFASGQVTEELIEALRQDTRAASARLIKRYERQQKEVARVKAMYRYEDEARNEGLKVIAGVDEAGRGPLAGPVSVAAVILPEDLIIPKINDSKKLSEKVRDELYDEIMAKALCVKQVFVDERTIDRVNILQATINGMYEAIFGLEPQPDKVLLDAVKLDNLPMASLSLIKGDAKSASIAAASIIAKVSRDRLMDEYDRQYPEYGFAGHKGYGTGSHIEAIRKYGPCPIHRLSFEPIKSMVEEVEEIDNIFSKQ